MLHSNLFSSTHTLLIRMRIHRTVSDSIITNILESRSKRKTSTSSLLFIILIIELIHIFTNTINQFLSRQRHFNNLIILLEVHLLDRILNRVGNGECPRHRTVLRLRYQFSQLIILITRIHGRHQISIIGVVEDGNVLCLRLYSLVSHHTRRDLSKLLRSPISVVSEFQLVLAFSTSLVNHLA